MVDTSKIGDRVTWNSEAGRVSGTIIGVVLFSLPKLTVGNA